MKILIVEDEPVCAEMIGRYLEDYATKIHYASSLESAYRYCNAVDFDLVILDLRLNDSTADNTIEAIPEIKSMQENPSILVVSGATPSDYWRQRAIDSGADGFLNKWGGFTSQALYMAVFAAITKTATGSHESLIAAGHLLEKLAEARI